jgi:LysR family glycine cleavage system transcriptional activator
MRRLPPVARLRAFEAAARHMSFKKAAEELGVTPTAISHQVRALEADIGKRLFRRRPRPLTLTEAGARLFPEIRDGFDKMSAAMSSVQDDALSQPLVVTTTNAFAGRWLLPRLALWQEAHPNITLEVIGSDYVVDLKAGVADLAVRYAESAPTDLVTYELFRDRYIPVCSPAVLYNYGSIQQAADLNRFVLIDNAWPPEYPNIITWRRLLEVARSKYSDVPTIPECKLFSFREEAHAIEAAIAGQGIAICSDVLVAEEIETGSLVEVLDVCLPGATFFLAHLQNHPRLPQIDEFVLWMRSLPKAASAHPASSGQ